MRPTAGRTILDGQPTQGVEPQVLARTGLVHVPQGCQTIGTLSVRNNLLIGAARAMVESYLT